MNFYSQQPVLCLASCLLLAITSSVQAAGRPTQDQSPGQSPGQSTQSLNQTGKTNTTVRLHWGERRGVARYRLQLARDSAFADIVFDRAVVGIEHEITDLPPGNYFWRVAPITTRLGEFSSAAPIEVRPTVKPAPTVAKEVPVVKPAPANSIMTGGGWRAAVGEINYPVAANLRTRDRFDIVGVNSEGTVFALDSASGVALWSVRDPITGPATAVINRAIPLLIHTRAGLDNVILPLGSTVTALEGASGREIWRASLPAVASTATVMGDANVSKVVVVDNTRTRIFLLDGSTGTSVGDIRLSDRVVGTPVSFVEGSSRRLLLAFAGGTIEVRDESGAIVRSGDAGSPATTAPLFVRGTQGPLVIVGTRGGLTALSGVDLEPLGRVEIKDDAPRGTLAAADLSADGIAEVIMITERGRVMSVNAADGKILWDAAIATEAETITFADVNADSVLDLLIASGQTLGVALSGRDGAIIWKDNEGSGLAANHSSSAAPRASVALPFGRGVLLIASEPSRSGLRAVEFSKGSVRSGNQ